MKKSLTLLLALLIFFSSVHPTVAWALTSGPSQPEFSSFTPFEQTSLVDNFSGDFKYNIPLLEIDGYPINLAYESSVSPEAEASWVGLGWNLNPGSIARNVRGLPDDFNGGGDAITTNTSMLPRQVFSAKLNITPKGEIVGFPIPGGEIGVKSFQLGLMFDNYYGLSFEYGFPLTFNPVGKSKSNASMYVGFNSQSGYHLTPGFTLAFPESKAREGATGNQALSLSMGIPFNSEQGFTGLQTSIGGMDRKGRQFGQSGFLPFGSRSFTPQLINDKSSISVGGTFPLGLESTFITGQVDVSGSYSNEQIKDKVSYAKAYGYLYHEGADVSEKNVITDYNRENDAMVSPELPLLPVAHPTYDYYSVSGQGISGNYRPYRAEATATFDEMADHKSDGGDLGLDIGGTNLLKLGVNLSLNFSINHSGGWSEDLPDEDLNGIVDGAAFSMSSFNSFYNNKKVLNNNSYESFCFKRAGELNESDQEYFNRFKGEKAAAINLSGGDGGEFTNSLKYNSRPGDQGNSGQTINNLRGARMVRTQTFDQLTAVQAAAAGFDKILPVIKTFDKVTGKYTMQSIPNDDVKRSDKFRMAHHISEVKVTREDGAKFYYGLPTYNTLKKEFIMAVGAGVSEANRQNQKIVYTPTEKGMGNGSGLDNFYQMTQTSPYATGYLLTAMVSSDYVDVGTDGPTRDDVGTYVRFNYKKTHSKDNPYRWRTPVDAASNTGNLSEGNYSTSNDNKAVVTYGEKEVYYVQNIVSKNYVAEFYTSDRFDALGALGEDGGFDSNHPLQQLDSIRLFSLADRDFYKEKAVPIKTVHFEYEYLLCPGTPNSNGTHLNGNKGKLTLTKVSFTYRNNAKGGLNPYIFKYSSNPAYTNAQDIWGMRATQLPLGGLTNTEFPYVNQQESKTASNLNSSAWLLDTVHMPTGGTIAVNYESDDYAFVQDKRAMQMFVVQGFHGSSTANRTDLVNKLFEGNSPNNYIYFNVDTSITHNDQAAFKKAYTEFITDLYFRCYVDLTGNNDNEFVGGYAEIEGSGLNYGQALGWVKLKSVNLEERNHDAPANPIAKLGWQNTRMYLNQLINPPLGESGLGADFESQLRGLKNKLRKILALIEGYNGSLRDFGYSKKVNSARSYIRLNSPALTKRGGGSRVKKLTFSDNWNTMAGDNYSGGVYGYTYSYKTEHKVYGQISSGVAQWEPAQGGDENPFRGVIAYKKERYAAPNDQLVRELPVAQALYPNGDVGYSRIEIAEIKNNSGSKGVGRQVHQFYTAKDFPIISDRIGPFNNPDDPDVSNVVDIFNIASVNKFYMSQGVSLEFSNMHGVAKSDEVYSDGGTSPISKSEYFYKQVPYGLTQWNETTYRLANQCDVMRSSGKVDKNIALGVDFDVSCDFREFKSADVMGRDAFNLDISGVLPFVFPLLSAYPSLESHKSLLRTASMVKTTSRTPILDRVVKTDLSSTVTEQSLVYDGITGGVIISSLQNQFDDPYYKLMIPAYWAYPEMGPSYSRTLSSFASVAKNPTNLQEGDVILCDQGVYWVVKETTGLVLMDNKGTKASSGVTNATIINTGARNQLNESLFSITCKTYPVNALGKLTFSGMNVIDAEALEYSNISLVDCACARDGSNTNVFTNGSRTSLNAKATYK